MVCAILVSYDDGDAARVDDVAAAGSIGDRAVGWSLWRNVESNL